MSIFHLQVSPNHQGRDFVVSDLHGHLPALERALKAVRFAPGRDRLFSVGDLVDRGPDSPGSARLLRNEWFFAVRGNHEDMLLRTLAGQERQIAEIWRQNGGDWGLDGLRANAAAREAAPLCAAMPWVITLLHRSGRRFGICHAQCPVDAWADIDQVEHDPALSHRMLWARDRIYLIKAPAVSGIDWTIHGHTIVSEPLRSANALFIETGCFLSRGRLTLLCLDDFN